MKNKFLNNTFKEIQSIGLVINFLASHQRIMPDIKTVDKWPYTDGQIGVYDDNETFIGNLFVQVKTMSKNEIKNKIKNLDKKFIEYCKDKAPMPILLFCVDNTNHKVFWKCLNYEYFKTLDFESEKIVNFEEDEFFNEIEKDYIKKVQEIIKTHNDTIRNSSEWKKSHEKISRTSNEAVATENPNFEKIQVFLDNLNSLIENQYSIARRSFIPFNLSERDYIDKFWKVGFTYCSYKENHLFYSLYPIPKGFNDAFIKVVSEEKLKKEFLPKFETKSKIDTNEVGYEIERVYTEVSGINPVENNPKKYAYEVVSKKIINLIEGKKLNHYKNPKLAEEVISSFINDYNIALGLEIKENYSIEEIEKGLLVYFPIWVEEADKFLMDKKKKGEMKEKVPYRYKINEIMFYMNISHLVPFIKGKGFNEEIKSKVSSRLKLSRHKLDVLPEDLLSSRFRIFLDLFTYLKNEGIKEIKNLYKPMNQFWTDIDKGKLEINETSLENIKYNLKVLFENVYDIYDQILENNFQSLKRELALINNDYNKIIVVFCYNENLIKRVQTQIKLLFLKSKSETSNKSIEIVSINNEKKLDITISDLFKKYEDNEEYFLVNNEGLFFVNLYSKISPALDLIYEELKRKIEEYFRNLISKIEIEENPRI